MGQAWLHANAVSGLNINGDHHRQDVDGRRRVRVGGDVFLSTTVMRYRREKTELKWSKLNIGQLDTQITLAQDSLVPEHVLGQSLQEGTKNSRRTGSSRNFSLAVRSLIKAHLATLSHD